MANDNPLRRERDAAVVAVGPHRVEIAYDPDGDTWYVRAASVPGLTGEAASAEALQAELPHLIAQATLP